MQIPIHFQSITVHESIVMPNHLHGILEIGRQPGAAALRPHKTGISAHMLPAVLWVLSCSRSNRLSKRARTELKFAGEVWQRNYFEKVLRDGQQLADARAYISENPKKWQWDRDNPDARKE